MDTSALYRMMASQHGAAARVHRLDGFDRYEQIDVIGTREQEPSTDAGIVVHRTRGPVRDHVVTVESIPVLDVPLTLALLAPHAGIGRTAKALDTAAKLVPAHRQAIVRRLPYLPR